MSATTTDHPGVDASKFSATLIETPGIEQSLTVVGQAVGDYRVQQVSLARAKRQESEHTLVLDIEATLGPVENPHPDTERVFPLEFKEAPAAQRYTRVLIKNGKQHFTISVEDVL
jgi:hypothetical protein